MLLVLVALLGGMGFLRSCFLVLGCCLGGLGLLRDRLGGYWLLVLGALLGRLSCRLGLHMLGLNRLCGGLGLLYGRLGYGWFLVLGVLLGGLRFLSRWGAGYMLLVLAVRR